MKKGNVLLGLMISAFFCMTANAAPQVTQHRQQQPRPQVRAVSQDDLRMVASMIARRDSRDAILAKWRALVQKTNNPKLDVHGLVQSVRQQCEAQLAREREAPELRLKALKNSQQLLRTAIARLHPGDTSTAETVHLYIFELEPSGNLKVSDSGRTAKTPQERQAAIRQLEGLLKTVGDDSQLLTYEMQQASQDVQRAVQALSTIEKEMEDSAMAVIRNMKD